VEAFILSAVWRLFVFDFWEGVHILAHARILQHKCLHLSLYPHRHWRRGWLTAAMRAVPHTTFGVTMTGGDAAGDG